MPPPKDPATGKFVKADTVVTDPPSGGTPAPGRTPAPEKKKEPEKEVKVGEGVTSFAKRWLGIDEKKPEEGKTSEQLEAEKKAKEKEDADKAKAAAEKKAGTKKVPQKPPIKPPEKAPLTAAEIAAAAAEGVSRAMKPAEKKEGAPAEDSLPPSDVKRISILQEMEKLYPDKYKGLSKEYESSKRALIAYADKWQKEHPGQGFDEDAEEHAAFMEQHAVDWEDDDYMEAVAETRAAAKIAEKSKELEAPLKELQRDRELRAKATEIKQHQDVAAKSLWAKFGENFSKVIKEDGSVDAEVAKTLSKEDPIGFEIRYRAADALDKEVEETFKLLSGLAEFDAKNPIHQNMSAFAAQKEHQLSAKAEADKTDADGKVFLPAAEYYKLPKEQRETYHWTFSAQDLAILRAADLATHAQKLIDLEEEKHRKWAEARGIKLEPKSQIQRKAEPEKQEEGEPADNGKPESPSVGGQSRVAALKEGNPEPAKSGKEAFAFRFLGQT